MSAQNSMEEVDCYATHCTSSDEKVRTETVCILSECLKTIASPLPPPADFGVLIKQQLDGKSLKTETVIKYIYD